MNQRGSLPWVVDLQANEYRGIDFANPLRPAARR